MTDRMEFKERIDRTRAYNVLALNKREFKDLFYDANGDRKGSNEWQAYYNSVRKFLTYVVSKDCMITKQYKYSDTNAGGRRYVKGIGVQSLQKTLRNYLCGGLYHDVDMVNAHPSILMHICDTHNIQCPLLRQYVTSRDRVLEENELTKQDILVAMYSDKLSNSDFFSSFFTSFVYEQATIKPALVTALGLKVDANQQHPMASAISRYINVFENAVLEKAMTAINCGDAINHVPMFDGFYVLKDEVFDMKESLRKLNRLLHKDYNGAITFVEKSTQTNVQLADRGKPPDEYADVKPLLEQKFFQTKQPFVFWQAYLNRDGVEKYSQLRIAEMKLACEEFPILDYKPNGDVFQTSIYNRWIKDPNRRQYECCDFVPYGKENNCPDHIWNTFQGFKIVEQQSNEYLKCDTTNFNTLMFNLCDCDVKICDFMIKYVAHMVQYPEDKSGVIVVFKSWAGVGKDTFMLTLKAMLGGPHVGTTGDIQDIFGNFNGLMEDKIAVFLNEMEGKHGVEYQNRLKDQATAPVNNINKKHDRPFEQRNCARIFVNSNMRTPVTVDASDRRYMVIQCGYGLVINTTDANQKRKNTDFWKKYYDDLENKYWVRSLYDWLMSLDLTGFSCTNYPITEARELMRHKNICPLHYYLHDVIKNNCEGFKKRTIKGQSFTGELHLMKFKDFFQRFEAYMSQNYQLDYELKQITVKQMLHELPTGCFRADVRFNMGAGEPQARFSTFDFDKIDSFLSTFVFKNSQSVNEDEVFELSEALESSSMAAGVTHF